MKKPYIAKNAEDPGLIGPPGAGPPEPKQITDRQLLLRIAEKLGVPTE